MPLNRRFKCYIGLHSTKAKLRMLLQRYRFDTCAAVLGLEASSGEGGDLENSGRKRNDIYQDVPDVSRAQFEA